MQITPNMTIGEMVKQYPSVAEVLQAEGVHCVGCGASYYETIEEGLAGHGHSTEQIIEVVQKLNAAIPVESGTEELKITENAAAKLKDLVKNKEGYGLRIQVKKGGCAGKEYAFDFENSKKENDRMIEIDGSTFYIDADSLNELKGAKIDYIDSLTGAGFKVSNPNAQKSCACGSSFS